MISSTFIHCSSYFHVYDSVTSSILLTFMCLSLYFFHWKHFVPKTNLLLEVKITCPKPEERSQVSQLIKPRLATANVGIYLLHHSRKAAFFRSGIYQVAEHSSLEVKTWFKCLDLIYLCRSLQIQSGQIASSDTEKQQSMPGCYICVSHSVLASKLLPRLFSVIVLVREGEGKLYFPLFLKASWFDPNEMITFCRVASAACPEIKLQEAGQAEAVSP